MDNNNTEKYWQEYDEWTEYDGYREYPEREGMELDDIINSVLNEDKRQTFECFWEDVTELAEKLKLPVSYVESEFIIEGELIYPD